MEEAQRKMREAVLPDSEKEKPAAAPKKQPEPKAKKGKKVRVADPKEEEEKAQKEAVKEQRRLERQVRTGCHKEWMIAGVKNHSSSD